MNSSYRTCIVFFSWRIYKMLFRTLDVGKILYVHSVCDDEDLATAYFQGECKKGRTEYKHAFVLDVWLVDCAFHAGVARSSTYIDWCGCKLHRRFISPQIHLCAGDRITQTQWTAAPTTTPMKCLLRDTHTNAAGELVTHFYIMHWMNNSQPTNGIKSGE